METILLEVDDNSYQTDIAFIKLLPNNRCRVLEDDELSADEHQHIRESITQIQQGNYSEFDDWEVVKNRTFAWSNKMIL